MRAFLNVIASLGTHVATVFCLLLMLKFHEFQPTHLMPTVYVLLGLSILSSTLTRGRQVDIANGRFFLAVALGVAAPILISAWAIELPGQVALVIAGGACWVISILLHRSRPSTLKPPIAH